MVDLNDYRERVRMIADHAQSNVLKFADSDKETARYYAGRRDGALSALTVLEVAENIAARERDQALSREPWNESTGEGVDLAAVGRLEAFSRGEELRDVGFSDAFVDLATETGALDQASGTVYSDADGGL